MSLKTQTRHLIAYRAIMNTGSITAAAEVVNLTQPAVSRLLAGLERDLGFPLFYRRGRRLVPTVEGRSFYQQIEGTLAGIDDIAGIANDIRLNKQGRMRICAIGPLMFGDFVPKGIKKFREEFPNTSFSVDMKRREDIDEWVVSRQADLGFTLLPVESLAVEWTAITTVAAVAIIPTDHRLADKSTLTPEDLRGEQIILTKQGTRLRQMADAAFLASETGFAINIETSTAISSCHLVAHGAGVGISDPFSVTGVRPDRLLVRRWEPELKMTYGAMWPRDRKPTEQSCRLLEILKTVADEHKQAMPEARSKAE